MSHELETNPFDALRSCGAYRTRALLCYAHLVLASQDEKQLLQYVRASGAQINKLHLRGEMKRTRKSYDRETLGYLAAAFIRYHGED